VIEKMKNTPQKPPTDINLPEEIFHDIGMRLVLLQNLETYIDFVAKAVFVDNEEAKKALLNEDPKTMGQLLGMLRKRAHIEDTFDEKLRRTLKARNLFVHELSVKYDLHSKDGVVGAIQFICETMDDLEEVSNVMKTLIYSFAKESGFSDPQSESDWREFGDLNQLEQNHMPKLKSMFKKK
jgi:uncharacterized protein YutE (UPF0331/DUF86 family)